MSDPSDAYTGAPPPDDALLPAVMPSTSMEIPGPEMVTEAIVRGGAELVAVGEALHPPVSFAFSAKRLKAAAAGEPCLVSKPPYKTVYDGVVTRAGGRAFISGDGIMAEIYGLSGLAVQHTVVGASEAEVADRIRVQQNYDAARQELVTAHDWGEGALALANEFGGINVLDPETTAQDLILRMALARQLGVETLGELVDMDLFENRVADMLAKPLAGLFRAANPYLEALRSAKENPVSTATEILSHLEQLTKEFISSNQTRVLALAIALYDLNVINTALSTVRDTRGVTHDAYKTNHNKGRPPHHETKLA